MSPPAALKVPVSLAPDEGPAPSPHRSLHHSTAPTKSGVSASAAVAGKDEESSALFEAASRRDHIELDTVIREPARCTQTLLPMSTVQVINDITASGKIELKTRRVSSGGVLAIKGGNTATMRFKAKLVDQNISASVQACRVTPKLASCSGLGERESLKSNNLNTLRGPQVRQRGKRGVWPCHHRQTPVAPTRVRRS